jgi:hypothetical protein
VKKKAETAEQVAERTIRETRSEMLRGEPLRIRTRDDLVTGVDRIEYQVKTRTGRLYLPEGYSVNMGGAVRLFVDIDPQARRIEVFSGETPENVYRREKDTNWEAFDVRTT